MCAHEGMQVRGERIVGVWMQLTSMAARRVESEGCSPQAVSAVGLIRLCTP